MKGILVGDFVSAADEHLRLILEQDKPQKAADPYSQTVCHPLGSDGYGDSPRFRIYSRCPSPWRFFTEPNLHPSPSRFYKRLARKIRSILDTGLNPACKGFRFRLVREHSSVSEVENLRKGRGFGQIVRSAHYLGETEKIYFMKSSRSSHLQASS